MIDAGLDIRFDAERFDFVYGEGVTGPAGEIRTLDDIRASLSNPDADGPRNLYAIAMDVARETDRTLLKNEMLLLGVVAYNAGQIGDEPIRSQGHIHSVSSHSGWSPPEVFEIWEGTAIIFMQESGDDDAGRCYAVTAEPGERVIVPPGWPHMVINARIDSPMVFGAICDRGYEGFEYDQVRRHGGLAFFPRIGENGISWERNRAYSTADLVLKSPRDYVDLLTRYPGQTVMYRAATGVPGLFSCIPHPDSVADLWERFVP
jgi:glucose-6-phosphate isomerase